MLHDWTVDAWEELREYEMTKDARLRKISEELEETREKLTAIRSPAANVIRVQNTKMRDDFLAELLDRENRLKNTLWAEQWIIKVILSGLACLSETERTVLETFAAMRSEKAVALLKDAIGYDRSQLYRIKDAALWKYTLVTFGAIVY